MGRLFWKFFFIFWLAQVVTFFGVGLRSGPRARSIGGSIKLRRGRNGSGPTTAVTVRRHRRAIRFPR
jgi:hypothetical protein